MVILRLAVVSRKSSSAERFNVVCVGVPGAPVAGLTCDLCLAYYFLRGP